MTGRDGNRDDVRTISVAQTVGVYCRCGQAGAGGDAGCSSKSIPDGSTRKRTETLIKINARIQVAVTHNGADTETGTCSA